MPTKISLPQRTNEQSIDPHEMTDDVSPRCPAAPRQALNFAASIQGISPGLSFRPGDRVHVFHIRAFHRPFIEGHAVIVASIPGMLGVYYVRFDDDTKLRCRQVLPGVFQSSPDLALEALQTVWRAGVPIGDLLHPQAGAMAANDNRTED